METETAAAAALPDDLLAAVLDRLPARSLAASCRVCKAWRDLIGERQLLLRFRRILPHAVHGLFINYQDYDRCHFLSRPTPTSSPEYDGGPHRIDGKFDFIQRASSHTWDEVLDHCHGLVESERDDVLHVCNPMTRWSVRLPPYLETESQQYRHDLSGGSRGGRRAFLVFDPFVSPEYKVLLSPALPRELKKKRKTKAQKRNDAARRLMEWPPSLWTAWHEFSSSTGRWTEKAFVREGEAAGTVGDLLLNGKSAFCLVGRPWRYAAYWQGALYMHCDGEFVSRFSMLDDKYRVIKSPIQLAERTDHRIESFLGRSEKGVYFAAITQYHLAKLRVWTLSESGGQTEWVPKDPSNLKINSYSWREMEENNEFDEQKFWILDDGEGGKNQGVSLDDEQYVCWNSDDDDNIVDGPDDQHGFLPYFDFLGFHPYKEVIFLGCSSRNAVAIHLNTPKVQYLGSVHLINTDNFGLRDSFVYTPCLID